MQTFLPYPDFNFSAQTLDWRRLGKQRVEVYQILRVLTGQSKGWANHPAVKMWIGHEKALVSYGTAMCLVWIGKGFKDTLLTRFRAMSAPAIYCSELPQWLGNQEFHRSHQSNLIRKDPAFYGPKFPGVPDNLPYIWPVP
jgi:hypothetical protein